MVQNILRLPPNQYKKVTIDSKHILRQNLTELKKVQKELSFDEQYKPTNEQFSKFVEEISPTLKNGSKVTIYSVKYQNIEKVFLTYG